MSKNSFLLKPKSWYICKGKSLSRMIGWFLFWRGRKPSSGRGKYDHLPRTVCTKEVSLRKQDYNVDFFTTKFSRENKRERSFKWLADWLTEMVDVYYKLFVVFVMMEVKESVEMLLLCYLNYIAKIMQRNQLNLNYTAVP